MTGIGRRVSRGLAVTAAVALVATAVGACGGGGGKSGEQKGVVSSNGKFDYEPKPPGRATGIRAKVTVDGETIESTDREIKLTDPDAEDESKGQSLEPDDSEVSWPEPSQVGSMTLGDETVALTGTLDTEAIAREFRAAEARLSAERTFGPAFEPGAAIVRPDDRDNDGVGCENMADPKSGNCKDNCPWTSNQGQKDDDSDGVGDACEKDYDGDGIADDGDGSGTVGDATCSGGSTDKCDDNCRTVPNPAQTDQDDDGTGDLCDEDLDGSGTVDRKEGGTDHDGDGIPTRNETGSGGKARDTDSDGVPDHRDPDDDGDGTATILEGSGGRDTDGDGTPDSRDNDSDGDGVPDGFEGGERTDSDGDGDANYRDTDDDGDGKPTADEIGKDGYKDEDFDQRPDHLDSKAEPCGLQPKSWPPAEIGTWNGISIFSEYTESVEMGGKTKDYIYATHLAPEGMYLSLQKGNSTNIPPSLAGASVGSALNLMFVRDDDANRKARLHYDEDWGFSTLTVSFSFDMLPILSLNVDIPYFVGSYDTGIGFGTSFEISAGLGAALLPLAIFDVLGVSVGSSTIQRGFYPIHGWEKPCLDARPKASGGSKSQSLRRQALEEGNPAKAVEKRLRKLAGTTAKTRQTALAKQVGSALAPSLSNMARTTGVDPAENIPAGSNGDFLAHWFETGECEDCANASLGNLLYRIRSAVDDSGGSKQQLLQIGKAALGATMKSLPEPSVQFNRQRSVKRAVATGLKLSKHLAARRNAIPRRFVADDVVEIPAKLDQKVSIPFTTREVADLVGASPKDVRGATLCVTFPLASDEVCGTMDESEITVSMTLEEPRPRTLVSRVDLTTADGDFQGAQVRHWRVEPAVRVVKPEPGQPKHLALTAPTSMPSGAPVTLNAVLYDEHGQQVDAKAKVTVLNARGETIGRTQMEEGDASFQFIPKRTKPKIEKLDQPEITDQDGNVVPGWVVRGTGFSVDAEVYVDGTKVARKKPSGDELFYHVQVDSHETIALAVLKDAHSEPLESGKHTVKVVNPGGKSAKATVKVE